VNLLQAAILGAIQGLTEFLPISSSAHLVFAHALFGWQTENDLAFDVALHIGTLAAVIVYFFRDFVQIARALLDALAKRSIADPLARLGLWIAIGTVPAVIAGVLLESAAESAFRSPILVAVVMIVFSGVMWLAEQLATQKRTEAQLTLVDTLVIGAAQAVALIPGVSRSGITISTGLFRGLRRPSAARFSFLLATPVTAGAALKQMTKLAGDGVPEGMAAAMVVGILSSAVVGFLCIAFLLRYLERYTLNVFVVYRIALAIVVIIVAWPRG
jgi:undecaprenyl-diphosphatase